MTSLLDPARIAKLRQKQDDAFVSIFLHRPLAILFLIPTADLRFITPNRITWASIVVRFAAAYLFLPARFHGPVESTATIASAIGLWHLGMVLDCMDGSLARYRQTGSGFGRFLDKVSDRIVGLLMVLALSLRAFDATGDVVPVALAMIYVSLTGTASTAKWIELGLYADAESKAHDPLEVAAPDRTLVDWLKYGLYSLRTIIVPTEMDLSLWGSIAVVLHLEPYLFYYLAFFIIPHTCAALTTRALRIRRHDLASSAPSTEATSEATQREPDLSVAAVESN